MTSATACDAIKTQNAAQYGAAAGQNCQGLYGYFQVGGQAVTNTGATTQYVYDNYLADKSKAYNSSEVLALNSHELLVLEQQVKFLKAIVELTFPNGIRSFAEDLTGLIGGTGERAKPIKMRSRKSPSPSPDSSGEDSRPTLQ